MKVLFATTNPAKVKKYKKALEEKGIELLTLKDCDINIKVEETGKNAIENAYIKAKSYYEVAHIPTIGMDNCLFVEELTEEEQPGTHVRRVKGKELTDEEMIEYYTNLVKKHGKKLTAKWVYGMVIYNGKEVKEYTWSKSDFYFVDKPCEKRNPGYPLDSISIVPEFNKYLVELTDEEMIEHYTNLVKKHGEKLTAKWVYGMVIYNGKEVKKYTWSKSNFYFADKPCEKRNPGYPLDSITIVPEFNKYLVELTEEEKAKNNSKNSDGEVIKFIVDNIN